MAFILISCLFLIFGVSTGWIWLLASIVAIFLVGWIFRKNLCQVIDLFMTIAKRNRFDEASTTAQVVVKDHRVTEHRSSGETTYTYEMLVQFDAYGTDGATRTVTLRTLVTKDLFDKILTRPPSIRYSQEDPRIAVLEGEKYFEPVV